jgi:hypothetical protein
MARSIKELFSQDEFWILLSALGAVLLNWPMLSLAAGHFTLLGIPTILVYITAIWVLLIIILYIFERGNQD